MRPRIVASKFLHIVEDRGDIVVYHSLHGNPIRIDGKVVQLLRELSVPHELEAFVTAGFDCLSAIRDLIRLGHIVPYNAASNEYEKWRTNIREIYAREPPFAGGMVLVVTTACNLSCRYCIASHTLPNNRMMTYPTAEAALRNYVSYLERIPKLHQIEPVVIFTGGEPLLQFKLIRRLCEYASSAYLNLSLKFRLITNGTLLDSRIAEFLKKYKFDIVVSLDGIEDTNDFYRKSSNKSPTFHTVWRGIETLFLRGINPRDITISAVYHEDHPDGLCEALFKQMYRLGIRNVNLNLDNLSLMQVSPQEMARRFLSLRSKAKSEGINLSGKWAVPAQIMRTKGKACAICSGAARSKLFVQPGGGLTFCDYHPKVIGRVTQFEQYVADIQSSQNRHIFGSWAECKGCEIEGFCSPCVLEREVIHKTNPVHQQQICEFLKSCTRLLLLER